MPLSLAYISWWHHKGTECCFHFVFVKQFEFKRCKERANFSEHLFWLFFANYPVQWIPFWRCWREIESDGPVVGVHIESRLFMSSVTSTVTLPAVLFCFENRNSKPELFPPVPISIFTKWINSVGGEEGTSVYFIQLKPNNTMRENKCKLDFWQVRTFKGTKKKNV